LQLPTDIKTDPLVKIRIAGVGGAGGRAVNRMISAKLVGVEYIALDTDLHDLFQCKATRRIQIGEQVAKGQTTMGNPDAGRQAISENLEDVEKAVQETDILFIVCGAGGGTASGAAPILAEIARDLDILTVGVVTRPLRSEEPQRTKIADRCIVDLKQPVDTLFVIPCDRLLNQKSGQKYFTKDYTIVDEAMSRTVRCISDLLNAPGLVNLDFDEVRDAINRMGEGRVGFGTASGEGRGKKAAKEAVHQHLIDIHTIKNASSLMINVTGGLDMTLDDMNDGILVAYDAASAEANILFGGIIDPSIRHKVTVTIVATGLGLVDDARKKPYHPLFVKLGSEERSSLDGDMGADRSKHIHIPDFIQKKGTKD